MTTKVNFPIRTKLLLLMSAVALAATISYLALALKLFKDDKTSLIYELNASTVKTLAAETESHLLKIADKVKLLTQGHGDADWTRAIFDGEPDLIAYSLFQPTEDLNRWKPIVSLRSANYLKLYGLNPSDIDHLHEQVILPFSKVMGRKTWAVNSTTTTGAPILTLALAVDVQGVGSEIAMADIRLDRILRLVSADDHGIATVFIVDSEGRIVVHPNSSLVNAHALMTDVPIVRDAMVAVVPFELKTYDYDGKKWIGAYASVGFGGLSVVSQIPEEQAFRASRRLIDKSVLFALIVITAALLISSWVSSTFTGPIQKLLEATERLSRWEFGESIHVKTNDEIAMLARSFNSMSSDLQNQRAQLESSRQELELKVKERTTQLETEKKQLSEAQDALIRTTRLASVGELAGAAAHEVLNPLNNMNIRIERIRRQISESELGDMKLLGEISAAWTTALSQGWSSFEKELRKPTEDTKTQAQPKIMAEEDLANLLLIAQDATKRLSERGVDLEFLSHEITRITRILNNMRSLSRVGGERKPIDIHMPIDETMVTLGDLLAKRKVTLVKDYGAESRQRYTVISDKDELVQVFSNLIRNGLHAIDSAKRRAGEIRVTTRRTERRIEVRISDNGTGIAKENLARVFEPSFTTKSVEEGTGLGLSISRRLVRAFDGDIEVEQSVEGNGSTFLVWLPVSDT